MSSPTVEDCSNIFFTNTVVSLFPVKIVVSCFAEKLQMDSISLTVGSFPGDVQPNCILFKPISFVTSICAVFNRASKSGIFAKVQTKWQVSPRNIISYKQQPLHIIF